MIKLGIPVKKPEYSTTRPSGLRGGGRAQRGYGKAYLKGGRVK